MPDVLRAVGGVMCGHGCGDECIHKYNACCAEYMNKRSVAALPAFFEVFRGASAPDVVSSIVGELPPDLQPQNLNIFNKRVGGALSHLEMSALLSVSRAVSVDGVCSRAGVFGCGMVRLAWLTPRRCARPCLHAVGRINGRPWINCAAVAPVRHCTIRYVWHPRFAFS